jgi:hypothetical protein
MHPGLKNGPFVPHNLIPGQGNPVPSLKFQVTPRLRLLITSGLKKREPRYKCLSEAKVPHSHRMLAEVSPYAQHLLHKRILVSPSKWRCLRTVLCLERRPITTPDCVLLKNKNLVFVDRLGPEISFRACLWVLLRLHHITNCLLSI